ncbi:methylated-DNA--[protein]-cysteine S-methyltransferase [uncultured Bacteroides sp.]|uniref:methylated-DNA--[protein]-cysteine S-methyltransferase n=1 Tax=uncultured Bacteroides sp. TaxID=162156 RepID=UPI002729C1CF|nr:methylated-DNA--[protein]-cysteine S-methyltransferase [uncultured Bacteroides sp.]
METILIQYYQSPYGDLLLGASGDKLCLCDWMLNGKRRMTIDKRIRQALHADYEEGTSEVISRAIIQLDEYFARKRTIFDVPLLAVGTEFQRTVWQELQNIPYGKTMSYGELSRKLGHPKAVRAVAAANGANALSIFIPCHRVVGSNHRLIGYAGGLAAKQGMLALEADSCDRPSGSRIG